MRWALAAMIYALAGLSPAMAADCPYNINAAGLAVGQHLDCSCPAAADPWRVYGSDRYTGDSGLCSAALHAGVIDRAGGPVTAVVAEGCQSYLGGERNGVAALAYGAYAPSVAFVEPLPPCPEIAKGEAAVIRLLEECRARGRDDAACACEVRTLTAQLGGGGVSLLHGINDALAAPGSPAELAKTIGALLTDRGLGVERLPSLHDSVAETRAALTEACGP